MLYWCSWWHSLSFNHVQIFWGVHSTNTLVMTPPSHIMILALYICNWTWCCIGIHTVTARQEVSKSAMEREGGLGCLSSNEADRNSSPSGGRPLYEYSYKLNDWHAWQAAADWWSFNLTAARVPLFEFFTFFRSVAQCYNLGIQGRDRPEIQSLEPGWIYELT